MKYWFAIAILYLFIGNTGVYSQNYFKHTEKFKITLGNNYKLGKDFIKPGALKLFIHGNEISDSSYNFDYKRVSLSLLDYKKFLGDTLIVKYEYLPVSLKKSYQENVPVKIYNKIVKDSVTIVRNLEHALTPEKLFGSKLQKSGSIIRGFDVGTNKDFSLNSGLRLNISGKLSDEIDIIASLTDENTPIQPEGNTERLDELDKVYIKIHHPNAEAVFGDYDFVRNEGTFGVINRKLQGLSLEAKYKKQKGRISFASSKGKFHLNKFNGIEAVQGPYRLIGKNNERDIIVIAGSEKVYVNGILMKRGENNDYTIDYSNAEITFSSKRLITSDKRIVVEFEYNDRRYNRDFFSVESENNFLNDKLNLYVGIFQESDDETNPLDFTLNNDFKKKIELAGDDVIKATVSGASEASKDSLGNYKGLYTKIDTIINGEEISYYKLKENGEYNVSFSYAGSDNGSYKKISLGRFEFVGINKGDYEPVVFLPLPEKLRTVNINLNYKPIDWLRFSNEFSISSLDKNKLSNLDDNDNNGFALNSGIIINKKNLKIFGNGKGEILWKLKYRNINERYQPFERIDEVEFDREYFIEGTITNKQKLFETDLAFKPAEGLKVNTKYGSFENEIQKTKKYNVGLNYNDKRLNFNYDADVIDGKRAGMDAYWLKQSMVVSYDVNYFLLGFKFNNEKKEEKIQKDSLNLNSLKFNEYSPYLNILRNRNFVFSVGIIKRENFFPFNGIMEKESDALTHYYKLKYTGSKKIYSELDLSFRKKTMTEKFTKLNRGNEESVLIRSQTKYNLLNNFISGNLYYNGSSQRSARLERVFLRVPLGTGNYKYKGDLNNNGISEENEFEQVLIDGDYIVTTIPTDELFPVIDLKTGLKYNMKFEKLNLSGNYFYDFIKKLYSETTIKIHENSKIKKTEEIYLMNFDRFLNDSTTIKGSNYFQQDIYYNKNSSKFYVRLRYIGRKSLNQYASGIENGSYYQRSIKVKIKPIKQINNLFEYKYTNDNNEAPLFTNRSRIVNKTEFSYELSYRPYNFMELSIRTNIGRIKDRFPETPVIIDLNEERLRINFSFFRKGRLSVEAERKEYNSKSNLANIPFEVTNGNLIGKNYQWRVNWDYKLASFVQSTLSYQGLMRAGEDAVHLLRAEVRAYF